MCDKAVDSCLLSLKLVPDWFVTSKMTEKLNSAVFSDDYIVFGHLDSDFVTFFSKDKGLNSITLDSINLDDDHFDYCNPETINHVRHVWVGIMNINNADHLKPMGLKFGRFLLLKSCL